MERRPQNNPRQLGYYYPQQMQGYYQQNAPVHSEPYVPRITDNRSFISSIFRLSLCLCVPPVFPNPYPIARPNQRLTFTGSKYYVTIQKSERAV